MSSGGKGGSTTQQSSSSGTSSTQIPDWLSSASQSAVSRATDLSNQAYTPYTGEMVAGTTADTQQAYQDVRNLQGAATPAYNASEAAYTGLLGSAAPITAGQLNTDTSSLYGNYVGSVVQPTAGLLGNYLSSASPATAAQVSSNASQLMSPYLSSVVNPTLALAQQSLAQQQQKTAAQAANVGAFGGSRQGVQEGVNEAQSTLGTESTISNLLSQGYNQALSSGTSLAENASQQGYNAASLLAGQLGTGYANAATQAGTIANQNQQAGLTAASQLPVVATAAQTEAAKEAALLQSSGSAQQAQQQAIDTSQMGQFYEAQDYPYQSLDTLLSAVGSVPYSTSGTSTSTGTTTKSTSPGLMNEVSGAVGTAATVASMFSDARLKKDISRVGETDEGTPIYTYKYKGENGPAHMGVLAQELMRRQPGAVRHMGGGLLGVDYNQVR